MVVGGQRHAPAALPPERDPVPIVGANPMLLKLTTIKWSTMLARVKSVE